MEIYDGDEQADVIDDSDVVKRVSNPAVPFGPLGDGRIAERLPVHQLARPAVFPRFNATGTGGPGGQVEFAAESQCAGPHGVIVPGARFDPLQDQQPSLDVMARIRRPIPGAWDQGTEL